jgi:divalent metal cation (Fe/Co/Zn/Cd) transporter
MLVILGMAFATTGIEFASPAWLVFRAVFGLVAAVVVVGFYVTMFVEAARNEAGLRNVSAVALFILFPIGSAFLYFWWTRHVRN